jgi:16S rRNA G527 N7-methylase RsmG
MGIEQHVLRLFGRLVSTIQRIFFRVLVMTSKPVGLTSSIEIKEFIQRHFDNMLSWFSYTISNAVSEELNNKSQIVKDPVQEDFAVSRVTGPNSVLLR